MLRLLPIVPPPELPARPAEPPLETVALPPEARALVLVPPELLAWEPALAALDPSAPAPPVPLVELLELEDEQARTPAKRAVPIV